MGCTILTLPVYYAHLKVGLWYSLNYSAEEAIERLGQGIKQYNVACGIENTETQGYHETITRFYVLIIDRFLREVERSQPLDELAEVLIGRYGDKSLLLQYYSRDRVFSKWHD